mgnify:CR=1 FL=1
MTDENVLRLIDIELIARRIYYARIGSNNEAILKALDDLEAEYRKQDYSGGN